MQRKRVILTIVANIVIISIIIATVSMGKNDKHIDNDKKNQINIENNIKNNSNSSDKLNENKTNDENVKIDLSVDLNNEKELLKVIGSFFKRYYEIDIPSDGSIKFTLNKTISEKNGDEILNAGYMGDLHKKKYYLNIVINKTQKKMERIDRYDYSVEEKEEEISEIEAKKIAEKFLKQVDAEKYSLVKDIKVTENSRDGYVVIFKDENYQQNNNSIIVAVNPYSSMVSSFMSSWK